MNDYGDDNRNRGYDDYNQPDDGEPRGQWFDEAQRRVSTPGTILQWFGLVSIFIAVTFLAIYTVSPESLAGWLWDLQDDAIRKQQQGNQQAQQLPPRDEYIKQTQIQGIIGYALSLLCSVPIFVGGSKMKHLQGYGWSMTGAIMAIIPCTNSCCCFGLPFGIWALVVLLNSDVKLAFTKVAKGD